MDPRHEEGRFSRFRRTPMDRIVGDREIMVRQAETRAEVAEARVRELETELATLRDDAARRDREVEELRERLSRTDARPDASAQVSAEVRRILEAAEQTAAEMVEQAEAESARRRREAEDLWRDLRSEVARMGEWRASVAPRLEGLQERLRELGRTIAGVPDVLEDALRPLAESVGEAATAVEEAEAGTHPPLLVTPRSDEREAPERSPLDRGDEIDLGGLSS